jgi:hypothetical protein
MQSAIGKNRKTLLPLKKQVHITLETQEEINQLFAMLCFAPIAKIINVKNSGWIILREKLAKTENYFGRHSLLNDHT